MNIDDQIFLNQLSQGLIAIREGESWFIALDESEQRVALRKLNVMIAHTSPRKNDVPNAIANSGLKTTYTPCVLLKTGEIQVQLAKIANLPQNELLKAFRLLIALLGACDGRRRREKPLDTVNHWWHRDLNDPKVVALIKQEFGTR